MNPGIAMSELILTLNSLYKDKDKFKDLALITVTHARVGDAAFGINPGFGSVMATLHAVEQNDFVLLKKLAGEAVENIAAKHHLKHSIRFAEEFPATVNAGEAVEAVKVAAEEIRLNVVTAPNP